MVRTFYVSVMLVFFGTVTIVGQNQAIRPEIFVSVSPLATDSLMADAPVAFLEASFTIPEGMHQTLQEPFFGIMVAQGDLPRPWTSGPVMYPFSDKKIADIPSYSGTVLIKMPLFATSPPERSFSLKGTVFWQLCYDDGVCLIPARRSFELTVEFLAGQGFRAKPVQVSTLSTLSDELAASSASVLPPPTAPVVDFGSLALILLFALLGGAILNLMPCVLPVLSIKALSLIKQAGESRSQRWAHAWMATAGILASLMALAIGLIVLQGTGASVGWGIQFQNPWYVLGILVVVLLFALSLFEVFNLSGPAIRTGRATGLAGTFFSGFLTVVLATPCTAPFLGTALALAFVSPWWVILLVFGFIGIGLALPFFLITVIPGALNLLPKPGKWMDFFRGLMAFALVGTGIWLATVLHRQLDARNFSQTLWFIGCLILSAWLYGSLQKSAIRPGLRVLFRVLIVTFALGSAVVLLNFSPKNQVGTVQTPADLPKGWSAFSEESVMAALENGQPVFVDFTAEWCLSCKINENGPLMDPVVLQAFAAKNVVLLRGDYTNADPVIGEWLKRYQRAGIPFYALLEKGKEALVFPELLTSGMLLESIKTL